MICQIYRNYDQLREKIIAMGLGCQQYPIGSKRNAHVERLPWIEYCDGIDHIKTRGPWGSDRYVCKCPQHAGALAVQAAKESSPQKRQDMTFENYSDDNGYAKQIKEWIADTGDVLIMFGGPGSGKTHLCAAAQFSLVEQGKSVEMIEAINLAELFHNARPFRDDKIKEHDAKREIGRMKATNFLIIDDLGTESNTQTFREGLQLLIDDMRGRLVITTNLKPMNEPDEHSMGRYQDRLYSRIMQGAQTINMRCGDYRKRMA